MHPLSARLAVVDHHLALLLDCPRCRRRHYHRDLFDPLAVCPGCGAELAVDLERAGVVYGRA